MLSQTEMLENLALDQYVVRPNMSKTSQFKFVVLEKEVIKQEGQPDRTHMKCAAQFRTQEDATVWAQVKRKQFVAAAMGKTIEVNIAIK